MEKNISVLNYCQLSGPELVPEWSAANSSGLALLDAGKETVTRGLLYILSQGRGKLSK